MHDSQRVRSRQRTTDLDDHSRHLRERERSTADPVGERAATKQPEHQERRAGLTPEVVQRHHVGMLDPSHELGFGLEPLHEPRVVGQLRPDRLDRHFSSETRLHGPVDGAERSFADEVSEFVAGHRNAVGGRQRRVADQDLLFEVHQHLGRIQPGLLGEVVGESPIGPQRLGLPPAEIQRPHLQRDELLPQRLIGDQSLQIGDRFGMATGLDETLATLLVRNQSEFLQPRRDRRQPPLGSVVSERPTRPQFEGVVVCGDRRGTRRRPRHGQSLLELVGVVRRIAQHQLVPVGARHHVVATDRRPES